MHMEAIEATSPRGTRLRLEFRWQTDRYAQLVSLIDAAGAVQPLLESIEGCASDDWPPSPPLQSLTLETRADGRRVALLLGMAGSSHWSASIEAPPGEAQLIFDIACRHGPNCGPLRSRYRCLVDPTDRLQIHANLSQVLQQQREIIIQPTESPASSGTTRWRFLLSTQY